MGLYDIFSYPFGFILSLLYNIFNENYAAALIVFTILAKLILLPGSISTQKNQAKTLRTKAKLDKIRKKYAGDQVKLNEELQAFYQREGYGSMTAGCGNLLIQFPIIIGLYGAIYKPLSYIIRLDNETVKELTAAAADIAKRNGSNSGRILEMTVLSNVEELRSKLTDLPASVFDRISEFDFTAFGYDLGTIPENAANAGDRSYMVVPVAAFLFAMLNSLYSFIRTKKSNQDGANNATMGCMLIFMPFMSLWLAFQFPVGIGVYWAANSLLGLIQMIILNKVYEPKRVIAKMMVDETNVRRSKEESVKMNTQLLKENKI